MKYFYMIGGNIVSAIFMWLITLYLVRINALEDLGTLSLVQSLGLMFFVFCTFKLMNVQISDTSKIFSEADYYFSRILSGLLCILLIGVYLLFSKYSYFIKICCLIYSVYYAFMILKEYFLAEFQASKSYKNIFISNSLSGILSCLLFVICYLLFESIAISIIGFTFAIFIVLIINHIMAGNTKKIYSNFNFKNSILLIKSNFFLGISALLVSSLILMPRFFIEHSHGLRSLGIFSALTSIMFFVNIFLNSITQVLLKDTIEIYDLDKRKAYKKISLNFLLISLAILIGLIPVFFLRDFITLLIFGSSFLKYSNEFFYSIALSGFLFWFNYGNFILTVQRNFNVQVYISSIVFISQLFLCYLLIDSYLYLGAFMAMGITYALGFFMSLLIFIRREILYAK